MNEEEQPMSHQIEARKDLTSVKDLTSTEDIGSLHARAIALPVGDWKKAWALWCELVDDTTFRNNAKSIVRCLLSCAQIGLGLGPRGASLMMEALLYGNAFGYPDMLLDLHDEDSEKYPMDLELFYEQDVGILPSGYRSAFAFAVREVPLFAIRLAHRMNDSTLAQSPLPGWPLLACLIDDIFRGSMHRMDALIQLACHLLQPCFDFRFPIMGSSARAFELEPQALMNRFMKHRKNSNIAKLEQSLNTAIQRITTYRLHFNDCVVDALLRLQHVVPRDLVPVILQYAALPMCE